MTTVRIDFPFHVGAGGTTATTGPADHVRDLVEQLLFTSPGERVNRPDFGCGLLDLLFEPDGAQLAATLQVVVPAALLRWLGDVVSLVSIEAAADDGTLRIALSYVVIATNELCHELFQGA